MTLRILYTAGLLSIALAVVPFAVSAHERSDVCPTLMAGMIRSHIPHVAIAVFDAEGIHTSFCSSTSEPLDPNATFEAASLSKPVFAAAVLMLVQRKELDLDRPLSSYLKSPYEHRQNPFGGGASDSVTDPRINRVTARMILSHTAGMPNWSRRRALTFIADPGQKWGYSGEGYLYLQRAVESITAEPLEAFVREAVLEPLGMSHSSFVWQEGFSRTMLGGHTGSGVEQPAAHYGHALASSTLYTTLGDYARFVMALMQPLDSAFAMEEQKQVEVRSDLNLAWGLGLAVEETPARSYFHWGANPGFQSFFLFQPQTRRGVLFLTDSDTGLDLVDTVVASNVPGRHPALRFPLLHPKD